MQNCRMMPQAITSPIASASAWISSYSSMPR